MARAAVPEAAVYKDGDSLAAEDEIRPAENRRIPPPATDAVFAHKRDESEFCVAISTRPDARHAALRFALVKTSAIGARAVVGGDLETARRFVVGVRVHPVVQARPLCGAGVVFVVGELAGVGPAPRLNGEAFQHSPSHS